MKILTCHRTFPLRLPSCTTTSHKLQIRTGRLDGTKIRNDVILIGGNLAVVRI